MFRRESLRHQLSDQNNDAFPIRRDVSPPIDGGKTTIWKLSHVDRRLLLIRQLTLRRFAHATIGLQSSAYAVAT